MPLEAAISALGGGSAPDTGWQIPPAVQAQRNADAARIVAREGVPDGGGAIPTANIVRGSIASAPLDAGPLSGAIQALTSDVSAKPAATKPAPDAGDAMQQFNAKGRGAAIGQMETLGKMASGIGASIIGGWRGLATLATGGSIEDAANAVEQEMRDRTYEPTTEQGKALSGALESPKNPMNWAGIVAKKAGETAQDFGASPRVATGVETAINAAPLLLGAKAANSPLKLVGRNASADALQLPAKAGGEAAPAVNLDIPTYLRRQKAAVPVSEAANAPETPTAAPGRSGGMVAPEKVSSLAPAKIEPMVSVPEAGTRAAAVESAPVPGGLPLDIQAERMAVLKRLGAKKVWNSALSGDVLEGATNAQTAKFDQPAGRAALTQFAEDRALLENNTNSLIQKVGGTEGLTEDALYARGTTLARPFDALREWFDTAEQKLYKTAEERSGGLPVVSTEPIEAALKNRDLKNTAMAQNQGHLLNAVEDQLNAFKENNPQGLTVANAEGFRKWLNQVWSNDNKHLIGKLKEAVDDAVTQSAGEDVYGMARQMHIQKMKTLENPNGIARLMDVDPNTPLNRVTPFEKMPTVIGRMPVDQFKNVIDTLRGMPEELKPLAAQAEGEIKAQMLNRIVDAATPKTKTPSPFWNNKNVNKFLNENAEKVKYLFTPEEIAKIHDIRAGGNILAVDAGYPGAAAQAANAVKQGLLGRLIVPAATSVGGGVGGFLGGAPGGAMGALAGRSSGESMAAKLSEKTALKKIGKRMTPLSEVGK